MSHLDEGTILALRDGALVSADAELHVRSCAECSASQGLAEERAERVSRALDALDRTPDLESARTRVRAAVERRQARDRFRFVTPVHLGRAAAVLLIAAGAAWAMPGSPIREWIESRAQTPTAAETNPQLDAQDGVSGIDVPVVDGGILIALTGVSDGARVEVQWIDEATARISGRPGSAYSFAEGRAEAVVAPGLVRVALPRDASTITVEVNGRIVMQRAGSRLDVSEDVVDQSTDRIVFLIRAR